MSTPESLDRTTHLKDNNKDKPSNRIASFSAILCVAVAAVAIYLAPEILKAYSKLSQEIHEHQYTTTIISYDPLIIHIENFLSSAEASHLKDLANGKYSQSAVVDQGAKKGADKIGSERRSETAVLPGDDTVVQAVTARAARFQGFVPVNHFEPLQTTKYGVGGEYLGHYDLLSPVQRAVRHDGLSYNSSEVGTDRVTTFFAILDDNCGEGCGTRFPRIMIDWQQESREFCKFVDCDESMLTFKPQVGNAVFWKNMREDGSIHEDTLHTGLPVVSGTKIGLNIWTRDGQYS